MVERATAAWWLGLLVVGTLASVPAIAADPRTVRIGALEIAFDAERWRVDDQSADAITMRPLGPLARKLDPVQILQAPATDLDACTPLVRAQLAIRNYSPAKAEPFALGSRAAVRLLGASGCRNATARGVAICTFVAGHAYVLVAGNGSCRNGGVNLFSGIDPLEELAAGARFVP